MYKNTTNDNKIKFLIYIIIINIIIIIINKCIDSFDNVYSMGTNTNTSIQIY